MGVIGVVDDPCTASAQGAPREAPWHASCVRIDYACMVRAPLQRKTPTNLSLPAALVRRAKELGLNVSQVVEAALEEAVKAAEGRRWLEENREGIDEYNALVAKRGVFGDGRRRF